MSGGCASSDTRDKSPRICRSASCRLYGNARQTHARAVRFSRRCGRRDRRRTSARARAGSGRAVPAAARGAPKPAPKLTKPPQIKKTVEPVYPPEALAQKLSADVTMMVDIDAEGKVSKVGGDQAGRAGVRRGRARRGDAVPVLARRDRRQAGGDPDRIHAALRSQDGGARRGPPTPRRRERRGRRARRRRRRRPDVLLATGRLREKGTRDPLPGAEVSVIVRTRRRRSTSRRWSSAGPTPRGASRSRASRASAMRVMVTEPRHEPCIRDLAAADVTRRQAVRDRLPGPEERRRRPTRPPCARASRRRR